MSKTHLADLQLAIMRVLWRLGEAPVADVHAELEEERGLALTTIATMLKKMEKKGVVRHRSEGRRFIYRPTVSEGEVQRTMVSELTSRLFLGDTAALVSHLLEEHEIDPDELEEIQQEIAHRRRALRDQPADHSEEKT